MSIDAIVQARRVPLVVPTEGMIDSLGVRDGQEVHPGDFLFSVSDQRGLSPQSGAYADQTERLRTLQGRVEAIDGRIEALEKIREGLAKRVRYHTEASIAVATRRTRQAAAARTEAASRSSEVSDAAAQRALQASRELERVERLRSRNAATQSELDETRAAAVAAQAAVTSSRSSASGGDAGAGPKLDAARNGILVEQGTQDVSVSQQQMDQIARDINQLVAERRALQAELDALQSRMQQTAETMESASGAIFTSPVWGVVSSIAATQGLFLGKNTQAMELIDCTSVYVEATVPTRYYDQITPGSRVRIEMVGRDEAIPGVVEYIRGGSVKTLQDPAAELPARKKPEAHAFIRFETGALKMDPGSFCYVGRAATVLFDRNPQQAQTPIENALRTQLNDLQRRMSRYEAAQARVDTVPDYLKR